MYIHDCDYKVYIIVIIYMQIKTVAILVATLRLTKICLVKL